MGNQYGRLGSLTLVLQPAKEKENSLFKPVKFRLKTDPVLHPAQKGRVE